MKKRRKTRRRRGDEEKEEEKEKENKKKKKKKQKKRDYTYRNSVQSGLVFHNGVPRTVTGPHDVAIARSDHQYDVLENSDVIVITCW